LHPTTDNFNQSVHLSAATPVHVLEPGSSATPGRYLEQDVSGRYSTDRLTGRDTEVGELDEWMPGQSARGQVLDIPFRGELILHFRQMLHFFAFSALTLLVGRQEEQPACKN